MISINDIPENRDIPPCIPHECILPFKLDIPPSIGEYRPHSNHQSTIMNQFYPSIVHGHSFHK